jgi:hypothetical protein
MNWPPPGTSIASHTDNRVVANVYAINTVCVPVERKDRAGHAEAQCGEKDCIARCRRVWTAHVPHYQVGGGAQTRQDSECRRWS